MPKNLKTLAVSILFTLASCTSSQPSNKESEIIIANNGMRLIALDTLVDGCKAYRQVGRPGQMVIQVIYYKHGENEFSPVSEGAICE